jgi:hypothetical protein
VATPLVVSRDTVEIRNDTKFNLVAIPLFQAARPDATALDGFLLSLSRHHQGRVDEARSDCDRALWRLGSCLADEATHDAAVEAIMTIRGLGVDEAEALLQDLVFPASPFGQGGPPGTPRDFFFGIHGPDCPRRAGLEIAAVRGDRAPEIPADEGMPERDDRQRSASRHDGKTGRSTSCVPLSGPREFWGETSLR